MDRAPGGGVIEVVKAENRNVGAAEWEPAAGFARKSVRDLMQP